MVTLCTSRLTYKVLHSAHIAYLCVWRDSQNKEWLFPYTAWNYWFYNRKGECLLLGTNWIFNCNSRQTLYFEGQVGSAVDTGILWPAKEIWHTIVNEACFSIRCLIARQYENRHSTTRMNLTNDNTKLKFKQPTYKRKGKGKAWTGPEGSRRLRFPDFKTLGTWRW